MPSLQEIRQFNNRLTSMGDEPEVVREWGEDLEEVAVPDAGLDDDLSSLLSDPGELSEPEDEVVPQEPEAPDFSELLADETLEPPPDEPSEPESPDEETFEFPEDFELPEEDFAEPEDLAEPEEPADLEEFVEPDESTADETPAEPDEPAAPALDEGDFSDFAALLGDQDFGADDEAVEADEAPDEDEVPADEDAPVADEAEEDVEDDLFAMPEDLSFDESEEAEPATADEDEFALPEDEFALPEGGFSLEDEGEGGFEETGAAEEGGETSEEPDFGDLSGFEFSDDDSFDESPGAEEDFSFDEPVVPGAEGGLDDVGDLDEVSEDDLDEFSLGDFGAEFGVLEEGPSEEDLNPAINVPEISPGVSEGAPAGRELQLSDEEFSRLQRNLADLPLNVKQEAERIVAEAKGSKDQVEKLCRMLVAGEGAQEVANYAGKVLGKKIRVPRGYEKRSGEQFEQDRESFAYQFRENIWPILRLALVFVVAAGVLGLAGYHLIFRPLYARSLYVEGLELIDADQYSLGNQTFERAWSVWPNSDWYYDYAEAFVDERQYTLAQQKYEELLFGRDPAIRALALEALEDGAYGAIISNHEIPKQGVLDFVDLESRILGDYERAERLVNLLLFRNTNDYEARLALGDNSMRAAEEDPSRLEDARLAYARLIEHYGQTDELLFRMMRYFIAVDNLQQVVTIKDAFQADPQAEIDPEIYAELAGYLIDNDLISDVEDVIFRALQVDRTVPELHYHLARYYRRLTAFGEEELALATARDLLAEAQPFSADRRAKLIDTHTRIGENLYDSGNYLDAQESFTEAIALYDQGRERRILGPDPELARVYARLGDIFYYVGREYEQALLQFDRAEAAGYREPNLDYKQGYVHYRENRVDRALAEFRQAAEDPSATTNALLWATANTHFRRDNLFASEAYYRELIDRVERERDSIRTLLADEDPRHQSVIEYMFRGYNNLGVALSELAEQTGDPAKSSQSLVYFTRSTELAENYRRDPATLSRSDSVDLAYLNQREALYPRPDYEMQIYIDIPEDLDDLVF